MGKLFIGIVKNGFLKLLFPKPEASSLVRLTTTGILDSVPPENGELNLVEFEETAIAVKGHAQMDWIYSASIVDTGEPIVTALVENVLGQ